MTLHEPIKTDTAAPYAIGTAVQSTHYGTRGHIVAIAEETGNIRMLTGAAMVPVRHNYTVVMEYEKGLATDRLSDGIIAPMVEQAARAHLPAISENDAGALLKRANEAMAEAARRREAERVEAEAAAAVFHAQAAARMPKDAKAVIVGRLVQDKSDLMTDYHGSTTERTIILAFSTHKRDLFAEMRKAARNSPETAPLADAPASAEHREKYSMGGGYYLKAGYRHDCGWKVEKLSLYHGAKSIPVGEWAVPDAVAAPVMRADASGKAAIGGAIEISEHIHTKKGFRMWICELPARVERATYDALLQSAKASGGWYSRPWNGTPGGFAFKAEDAARAFAAEHAHLFGGPHDDGPKGNRPFTPRTMAEAVDHARVNGDCAIAAAEKLHALADKLDGDIARKLGDRPTNTPKRMRQAAEARIEGARLQRTQAALRALADLYERGAVPAVLAGLKSRKAVYELVGSRIDRSRAGYYDAGIDTGEPADASPAAAALWALLKPQSAEEAAAEALRRKVEALQFAKIDGYVRTPAALVADMLDRANIPAGEAVRVLEPSAGDGAIADAVRGAYPAARVDVFERHCSLREILKAKGFEIAGDDFMGEEGAALGAVYDYVLMNPPFERLQDIDHVRRAFAKLKPGGRLVAIMSPGAFFRRDAKAADFRAWFEAHGGEKFDIAAGAFKESGTGISAVMVCIDAE